MPPLPTLQITASQLAAFVRSGGVELNPLSPVQDAQSFGAIPDAIRENADAFVPFARTLAAPTLALVASTAAADTVVFVRAYGSPATGKSLVGCTSVAGNTFELVPTLDPHTWPLVLFRGLALETIPDQPAAVAVISRSALLACCALVDALKEARLNALLAREDYPAPAVSTSAVIVAAKASALTADARWFSGLVRRLLPEDPGTINADIVQDGLKGLESIGWITGSASGEWSFSDAMSPAALEWSVAAVSGMFSLHLADDEGPHLLHLGLIRTATSLWTIECSLPDAPVKFGRTGARELLTLLTKGVNHIIDGWEARPVPRQPEGNSPRFCAYCGATLLPGSQFCAGCGKPLQQPATPTCPNCSKAVHAGEKFCGSCGHQLS